jgi:hypothetical protein
MVLVVFPVFGENSLVASKPMISGTMTAPPAMTGFEAGTRDLNRTVTPGRTLYRWSLATVLAANVADVASSWSQQEANPVVSGGGAQFGVTSGDQDGIRGDIAAGSAHSTASQARLV